MQKITLLVFLLLLMGAESQPQSLERLLGLKGSWKFSIGDEQKWASPDFDDSHWNAITAPSAWEDQGYYGYDGFAWYRKSITIPQDYISRKLFLQMGYIDDVDEVYLNGHLVGKMGSLPPHYRTAYNINRVYYMPSQYINFGGRNVIAVRVFDAELSGGITGGELGIYTNGYLAVPDLDLSGQWKFAIGDGDKQKDFSFDDRKWESISVPSYWEVQGHDNYDGIAWYRKKFRLPANMRTMQLVLMLGKIDDLDEVYLNGTLIGKTGQIKNPVRESDLGDNYLRFRGYYIPQGLLKENGENIIAVRVYDGYKDGGIYEGPIGLISQTRYTQFWKAQYEQQKRIYKKSFWESLF